jgi:hypothetical protein
MGLWKAIKDWFGYTSADELAKLKEAEKKAAEEKAAAAADAAIKQSLENIEALGQKIDSTLAESAAALPKKPAKKPRAKKETSAPAKKPADPKKEATKKLANKIVNRKTK